METLLTERRNMRDLRVFACQRFTWYAYERRDTLFCLRNSFCCKYGRTAGSENNPPPLPHEMLKWKC